MPRTFRMIQTLGTKKCMIVWHASSGTWLQMMRLIGSAVSARLSKPEKSRMNSTTSSASQSVRPKYQHTVKSMTKPRCQSEPEALELAPRSKGWRIATLPSIPSKVRPAIHCNLAVEIMADFGTRWAEVGWLRPRRRSPGALLLQIRTSKTTAARKEPKIEITWAK